jgi:hypothetical protein
MFLNDLRRQQVSHGFRGDVACSEHVTGPVHASPDDHLIADCRALTTQISDLLAGMEKASVAKAMEYEFLMASLRQTDDQLCKLVDRVGDAQAFTDCGLQCKHAVVDLLVSLDWHDGPTPYRDALLLSFLRDIERLHYPAVTNSSALIAKDLKTARGVIENGETCLTVIEELTAGFKQLEQGDELSPAAQEQLIASLSGLLRRKRTLVKELIRSPAPFATAIEAKRMVLQRLLEIGTSDMHELRIDLSRSYLGDLRAYIQANGRGQASASAASSIWSTISSKLRWLTSSFPHR